MKNLLKKSLYVGAFALGVTTSGYALAQTAAVTATVSVLNSLTLATAQQLNFGQIVAVGDTGQTASATVDTAGVLSVATTGGTAVTAIIDNAAAQNAQITIADGANGATINVDIQAVVNPTDGTDTFTLAGFMTSYNGAAAVARTAGTPWTETFDSAFGGGTNTLDLGATITTADPSAVYGDGTYNGGFNVVFSY